MGGARALVGFFLNDILLLAFNSPPSFCGGGGMWGGVGGVGSPLLVSRRCLFSLCPPSFNSVDEKSLPTPCTHADTPPFKQKGMYKDFSDFEITKAPPLQSLAPPLCDGKQILALVLGLLRL